MLRIDNATLKARVSEVEETMKRENLDALVVYANGSALGSTSKMHGYLRFLCNYDGHNTPAMLILRPGHEPVLLTAINAFLMRLQTRELLWFKDVRIQKPQLLGEDAVSVLASQGGARQRIGYIGYNETPAPVWKSLEKGIPNAEWIDFAPVLDRWRVQKGDIELAFHRRAGEICDALFQTFGREVRSGKKGYQLQAAMEHTARYEGAEYCITWLSIGPRVDYPRFYKEECVRVPQEGDTVMPGIYLTYDGHWGHAIRTGVLGKPSDDQQKLYDIAREMEETGLSKLRPGDNLYEVNDSMLRVLLKHYKEGEVEYSRPGHGLGYSYEDPVVSVAFPQPWDVKQPPKEKPQPIELKPGMLMELHPNLFVPGVGGAMIGDVVAVTETGYEILTEYPRDLIRW